MLINGGLKLNPDGFGSYDLPINHEQIKICENWIKINFLKSTKRNRYTSYFWKHAVENSTRENNQSSYTYISNGAFIQACINLGYNVKCTGLNALIYARVNPSVKKRNKINNSRYGCSNV